MLSGGSAAGIATRSCTGSLRMQALYPDAEFNCNPRRTLRSFEFEECRFIGRRRFDDEQAEVHGLRNQVRAVARVQFQSHIFDMPFDGARCDIDLERDLLGRAADGHQLQYLMFTKGQMRFDVQSILMHGAIP